MVRAYTLDDAKLDGDMFIASRFGIRALVFLVNAYRQMQNINLVWRLILIFVASSTTGCADESDL